MDRDDPSTLSAATAEALVRRAMDLAAEAAGRGDAPFAAVLATTSGEVRLEARNTQASDRDPTAHAEINLVRAAARELGLDSLEGLVVASNAESCSMCASALVKARVAVIVFGAPHEPHMDPALGLEDVLARSRHPVTVIGPVLGDACAAGIAAARRAVPAPD